MNGSLSRHAPTPYLPLIAMLLLAVSGAAAETSTNVTERLTLARKLWDQALERTGGTAVKSDYYPTEPALPFMSAYLFTREQRFADQAARQLELAHNQQINGMILSPLGATRDYQARQIYNFYTAYRVFGEGKYLRWADDCAQSMIKIIPRGPHRSGKNGQTNVLFSAGFFDPAKPGNGKFHGNIDANQNAEVALAYSLLYFDPASQFFLNPLCKEIAMEETLASMTIQDMETGAIALTDDVARLDDWDTLYGGYVSFLWTWLQQLWRDERFEPHLKAGAKWLGSKTDLEHGSDRYYPNLLTNEYVSYSEVDFKLPVLWHGGVDSHDYIKSLFARRMKSLESPDDPKSALAALWAWAHYDLMGMPRGYYVDGSVK
jgi:hypothetical protein